MIFESLIEVEFAVDGIFLRHGTCRFVKIVGKLEVGAAVEIIIVDNDATALTFVAHYPNYENSELKNGGYSTVCYVIARRRRLILLYSQSSARVICIYVVVTLIVDNVLAVDYA